MALIAQPFDSLERYVAFFDQQPLPVLKHTVRELQAMREQEDDINGRTVAALVLGDPLMTLKVLIHIEAHRRARQNHDITTIERAIMMMGISPFLREFSAVPTIEDQLGDYPKALVGVLGDQPRPPGVALRPRLGGAAPRPGRGRDHRCGPALGGHRDPVLGLRADPHPERLRDAARRARPALVHAQRMIFNFSAKELQLALVRHWHLPDLLVSMMDEKHIDNARVRTVQLAASLSRHTAQGWNNPAIPDDLSAIESLLHIGREHLLNRVSAPHEAIEPCSPPAAAPRGAAAGLRASSALLLAGAGLQLFPAQHRRLDLGLERLQAAVEHRHVLGCVPVDGRVIEAGLGGRLLVLQRGDAVRQGLELALFLPAQLAGLARPPAPRPPASARRPWVAAGAASAGLRTRSQSS
jgi:hypothetical protein